jgi:acyl carrier protein
MLKCNNTEDADIKEKIREFIANYFLTGEESKTVDNDDSFLEKEIIDSTGVLELVAFLEETFSFRVEDEEIIPANLDSINKLVVYVRSKLTSNNS